MPDIGFVAGDDGGGNVANINTSATKLTWPGGFVAGDIALILWVMQNTATPTIPSGWNVDTSVDGTNGASRIRFMWHLCDGTESGDLSLTNSGALVNRQSAGLAIYRGVDPDSPFDATTTIAQGTAGTTHANPAIVTGSPDSRVGCGIIERSTTGTNAWTPPTGYSERADSTTDATGSGGTIVAMADDGLAVARKTGTSVTPPVWTSGNAFSTANTVSISFSLRPQQFRGWGVPIR